ITKLRPAAGEGPSLAPIVPDVIRLTNASDSARSVRWRLVTGKPNAQRRSARPIHPAQPANSPLSWNRLHSARRYPLYSARNGRRGFAARREGLDPFHGRQCRSEIASHRAPLPVVEIVDPDGQLQREVGRNGPLLVRLVHRAEALPAIEITEPGVPLRAA